MTGALRVIAVIGIAPAVVLLQAGLKTPTAAAVAMSATLKKMLSLTSLRLPLV